VQRSGRFRHKYSTSSMMHSSASFETCSNMSVSSESDSPWYTNQELRPPRCPPSTVNCFATSCCHRRPIVDGVCPALSQSKAIPFTVETLFSAIDVTVLQLKTFTCQF